MHLTRISVCMDVCMYRAWQLTMLVWWDCHSGSFLLVSVARFEFLMAMDILGGVMLCSLVVAYCQHFRGTTACIFSVGHRKFLWNVGIHLWSHLASLPKITWCWYLWLFVLACNEYPSLQLCCALLERLCFHAAVNLCFSKQFREVINLSIQFCFQLWLTV